MKKKIFVLLLMLCLSVTLIACDKKESNNPEETKQANTAAETSTDEAGQGIDLIKSMGAERPQTLRIVSEMTASNMTTTMTTYYDGDKSKTEIDVPNIPKSILIHIPNKEVMYQYVYGESTGMKITGADKASAEEMGLMMDTSLLTALTEGASDDITARKEDLDGEEVIYIESTQSDEDTGEMLVKMWYSERYATPLKYEVYVGDTLMTESKVTKINDNVNFNADTFTPPSDIVFQEVAMDTMMNFGE